MRKAPSIFLFALAAGLAGPVASAQPDAPIKGDPPSVPEAREPGDPRAASKVEAAKVEAAKVAARRLAEMIKRGSEQCAAGDVDEGLPALRAAWTQRPEVDLAVILGSCEIKAMDWPSAAEHLAYALRNKDDAEQRKSLEATFVSVRARVGAVKVTVTVDGADVFAGDRFAGQTPLPGEVYVAPGRSRIFAKKIGYGEIEGTVDLKPGGVAALKLDLASGGAIAQSQRVTSTRSSAPAYVMGALGVAALGLGAALYAAGLSKGNAANDVLASLNADSGSSSPCFNTTTYASSCATLKNLRSSHDSFANAGTGLLAAGGALAAAGLVYGIWATFATPPSERPSTYTAARSPLTLDVAAAPGSGSVWLRGAF